MSNSPQTYTGAPRRRRSAITASSVPGAVANVLTGGAATQTTAGTYAVTADFVPTDTANYNTLTGACRPGNFVIKKATPTATLTVSNSPQTYTGSGLAATVGIATSSVPGAVANVLTGGAATQTKAGTYAVTADFVPTDTTNYNTLTALAAGNFVIDKATPTATLAVSNSPQTYTGVGPGGDGRHHDELGARRGGQRADGRGRDADDGGDLCGDGGLRADRHGQLQHADGARGRQLRHREGDADGDAGGEQLAADVHGAPAWRRRSSITASSVPGAVANMLTGGAATQTTRRHLCGDGGLRADRHDQLQHAAGAVGRELRDQQGDADGDAGGEQLAADVHGGAAGGDGRASA